MRWKGQRAARDAALQTELEEVAFATPFHMSPHKGALALFFSLLGESISPVSPPA
eukprot:CAMPEP_0170459858 /NCGR_PEP_ID=MMETSP0123-20130129/6404_1 /TAXON_ID=182087 /ORGANISM="Favella ehrenbergii, Strain Fehren 1" /LENGTH=54 /DNA_ID=CAMNT_0010724579 /DNA_START=575 /DNA_END=736 /DNA_ORIENTATION=-